ncbi:MAG: sulfotransferase [Rhodothermaceae bacterium]|nr:MAG: sulfotransferase [Rhodothermaceae bacterium]
MIQPSPTFAPERSPVTGRLPYFILGGAMKSGTTTLHHMLARHPRIFMPDPEIHFFCLDDITQMPDLFARFGGQWSFPDYEAHFETYLDWYRRFFAPARTEQLVGEDSTVYLASEKAPARIKALLPHVKLVFLLRDPVDRTYSHYWHLVATGRATWPFEQALQYGPETMITRSFYRRQLERYFALFPREQIRVILFERFVRNVRDVLSDLCSFLGVPYEEAMAAGDRHHNRARTPRWVRLMLWQNRLLRGQAVAPYAGFLPGMPAVERSVSGRLIRFVDRGLRYVNRREGRYPPMRPETRDFLARLFARENAGLSDLIGQDVAAYWPSMRAS